MEATELFAELNKRPDYIDARERMGPELEIASQVVRLRLKLGWTQKELAQKVGTRQSAISRIENAAGHPSLSFLKRIAQALGARLNIEFEPLPAVRARESLSPAAYAVVISGVGGPYHFSSRRSFVWESASDESEGLEEDIKVLKWPSVASEKDAGIHFQIEAH
ncbi:MAG: helix-turn-helix transcriptional regulator [Anaerolineae bacterium]|nr:helix-turn-helix transcriptional regulator [Anaerolineae bacterium]